MNGNLPWTRVALWMAIAAASFHLAYFFPPCAGFIGVYLFALLQLSRQKTRFRAMNTGWLLSFLIYAPHLAFFWSIFGPAAIALWLVLGFWLGLFLALVRFARERWGEVAAAWLAPVLWLGLEYFRSELYYLRFSWLNVGYAFAWTRSLPTFGWLGVYGIGFVLMSGASFLSGLSRRRASVQGAAALTSVTLLVNLPQMQFPEGTAARLRVAGMQLEFPDSASVPSFLDQLLSQHPEADLYILSEYTFQEPIPSAVKQWCRAHGKYLLVGGKEPVGGADEFFNMASVIGPSGEVVFQQAKAQPIQFFKDGRPALQQTVWNSPWGRLGICICYDLSYARVVDRLARQGAQAILVPTMDVEEWGVYQHRLHARVGLIRAAEYRVPIVRLASSGVSQIVWPDGRFVQTREIPGRGEILSGELPLGPSARRPLDRWLAWPAVGISGLVALWGFCLALKPGRNQRRGE